MVFDYVCGVTDSFANVAAQLASAISGSSVPFRATATGASITITSTQPGIDGNGITLLVANKTSTCTLAKGPSPGIPLSSGSTVNLVNGCDPVSFHVSIDFTVLGIDSLRQAWLTFAPTLNYSTGNPSLVPYVAQEWSAVVSNWAVTDLSNVTPLSVAGPGSVVVASHDTSVQYAGSGWVEWAGFYYHGFSKATSHAGDSVTIRYSCQSVHDIHLGTYLAYGNGTFHVSLDGVSKPDRSTALEGALTTDSPFAGRRLLVAGVAAGTHTVVLTVASGTCCLDYLQAAVKSAVQSPAAAYSHLNAALDFDTDQTYKIAPARALWTLSKAGFTGDIDFYAGVFFALKRVRVGGSFHSAVVTISGPLDSGNGFGGGSATTCFFTIGGTSFGAAAFPADTVDTMAQRMVDAINATFVGV